MRKESIKIISVLLLCLVYSNGISQTLTSTQLSIPLSNEEGNMYGNKIPTEIEFILKNKDELEMQTKEQLQRLVKTYTLNKWLFTSKIIIDSDLQTAPHSHPTLTLNTRHIKDDELLLATFIHEQLHWFISGHASKNLILSDLMSMYPVASKQFHEQIEWHTGTYFHIIICYLEYKIVKGLLGELKAYQVIDFWQTDHYQSIYRIVIEDQKVLEALVNKFELIHKL